MSKCSPAAEIAARDGQPPTSRLGRRAAIIEVVLAFVFVHVAYRAIKYFTGLGRLEGAAHLNFTPGAVMILFTLCVVWLRRSGPSAYGLGLARLSQNLKVGVLWGALLVSGVALLRLLGVRHQPGLRPPTMTEGEMQCCGRCGHSCHPRRAGDHTRSDFCTMRPPNKPKKSFTPTIPPSCAPSASRAFRS